MKLIPNFITSLNLASGFIAIIFVTTGDILTASWMILAAMIFDFLDGFAARMLKAYSAIGKELDSLADVVSFGVAPALLIYQLLSRSIGPFITDSDSIKITLILFIPAIMPVFAALRLAIFNLDSSQTTIFKGLPVPANAIAVISLIIAGHYSKSALIASISDSPLFLILLTIILSSLMVSRIPLLSLKITNFKLKGNEGRYLLVGSVLISFIILGISAAPLIIPLYIISSLVFRPV